MPPTGQKVWQPNDFMVFSDHVEEVHGDARFHEECADCNRLAFIGSSNAQPRRKDGS